jgi:hypothetical protein
VRVSAPLVIGAIACLLIATFLVLIKLKNNPSSPSKTNIPGKEASLHISSGSTPAHSDESHKKTPPSPNGVLEQNDEPLTHGPLPSTGVAAQSQSNPTKLPPMPPQNGHGHNPRAANPNFMPGTKGK